MPIDTSIALGVRPIQLQTLDPMSIYSAMEEQRYNALRERALEQQMAQNALTMQNAMEDRRAAAAQAAQERRRAAEFAGYIRSGYTPGKEAVMGPGTVQGSTPASYNPDRVLNALYAKGDPALLTAFSNLQEQFGKQREIEAKATGQGLTNVKTQAETLGVLTDNQKKQIEAADAQLKQMSVGIGSALSPEAVHALYKANPAALAVRGMTPDKAIEIFDRRVAEFNASGGNGFDRARMEVERGIFDTAKQLSDEVKILESPQGQFAYTPRTNTTQRIAAPTGEPIMPTDKRTIGYEPASEMVLKKSGESLVDEEKALRNAPSDIDNLEKAKALIPQAATFMGPGGELKMDVVSFFNNTFKTEISTEGVKTAQELESRLFRGVMDNLKKMDSQPTQQQQEALRKALGQLKNDPAALGRIIDVMQDAIRKRVELHNSRVAQAKERGVQGAYDLDIKVPPKPSTAAAGATPFTPPAGWSHVEK
jgi:hypothetical protein